MYKKLYFSIAIICLLCLPKKLSAQYGEFIASGRPGAAIGTGTVGQGILQFQTGVQFSEVNSTADSIRYNSQNVSEALVIRYGLQDRFEIQIAINNNDTRINLGEDSATVRNSGLSNSKINARTSIGKNMALQVGVNTTLRSSDFSVNYLAPEFKVMYDAILGDNAVLTTNLGAVWDGIKPRPRGLYVFSLTVNLTKNIFLVSEAYGDFQQDNINNYFDFGLGYFINNDLMVDINSGWGENYPYKSYFATVGVSYRMKTNFRKED